MKKILLLAIAIVFSMGVAFADEYHGPSVYSTLYSEQTTVSTPPSGMDRLYFKSTGLFYKNAAGTEYSLNYAPVFTPPVFIGDTANANSAAGLTINQGANDDEIVSLKSSTDVSVPFTTYTEADTYGYYKKESATGGGLKVVGLSDTDATGIAITGYVGSADPADTTPAIMLYGAKSDGSTAAANLGANETVTLIKNGTSSVLGVLGSGTLQIGGIVTPGTSLAGGAVWKAGTAPSTSPADAAQIWVQDTGAVAGKAALHMRDEVGNSGPVAFAKLPEYIEAATDTLTIDQCYGGMINNYGQAADVTLTIPTISAGMNFDVILGTAVAKYFRLDPDANTLIILDGVASTDGKYIGIAAAVQGAAVTCRAIQTGAAAYDWACYTISGAWAAE